MICSALSFHRESFKPGLISALSNASDSIENGLLLKIQEALQIWFFTLFFLLNFMDLEFVSIG